MAAGCLSSLVDGGEKEERGLKGERYKERERESKELMIMMMN